MVRSSNVRHNFKRKKTKLESTEVSVIFSNYFMPLQKHKVDSAYWDVNKHVLLSHDKFHDLRKSITNVKIQWCSVT